MSGFDVAILVTCFCVLVAGLFAVIVERTNERDEARAERDHLEAEADALAATVRSDAALVLELDTENMRLHDALTEAQIAAGTVRIPGLHVVREGSDYEWPAIARVLDIDGGDAS